METKFYLWATLLTEHQGNALMSGLVRRNFAVMPLGREGSSLWADNLSCLCTLLLTTQRQPSNDKETLLTWVMDEVKAALNENGGGWFSLVVMAPATGNAVWTASTIKRPDQAPMPVSETPPVLPHINNLDEALGEG